MSKSRASHLLPMHSGPHRSVYPSAPPQEAAYEMSFGMGFSGELPMQPPPYSLHAPENTHTHVVAPPLPSGPPPPFPEASNAPGPSSTPQPTRPAPSPVRGRTQLATSPRPSPLTQPPARDSPREPRTSSAPPRGRNQVKNKNKRAPRNAAVENRPLRRSNSAIHFAENTYEEIKEYGLWNIRPIARFKLNKKPHKKYNPQLYTKRNCTDVFCCLLFIVFIAGWVVVASLGFMWGNPERLIFPTDSQGRRCGAQRTNAYDLRSKPYLFYFDLTKCISYATALGGCPTTQICVAKCPQNTWTYLQMQVPMSNSDFMKQVKSNVICEDDVDKNSITSFAILKNLVEQRRCASYTVKSAQVLQRCIPQAIISAADTAEAAVNGNVTLDMLNNQFGDAVPRDSDVKESSSYVGEAMMNSTSVLTKIIHDVLQTWWQTLSLIAIAGVLAFVWTVIMRIFGGFMIWTSILAVILGLSGGCAYSWLKWNKLKKSGAVDDFSFQPIFSVYFEMPTTWFIFAITISVILAIVLLVILFIRKRISIAVALIEESSKAVGSMMSTLIFPIFPFILHLIIFALWGTIAVWLASTGTENCRLKDGSGKVTNSSVSCDCNTIDTNTNCVFVNVTKEEEKVFWLQLYNIFAFFWLTCFVTALGDIALAGAFASYYWAKNKSKDVPSFPVLRSLGRAIRYNLGSLAFGSLIIATVKLIRVILEYLDHKLAKTNNKAVKTILSACKCCFWCLEVFLKFLTKNAYIMMAIYGKPFFTSAKDSFFLLVRNAIRTVVVHQVANILLFIGKAMITVGMGVVSFYYFSGQWIVEGIPRVELYYYFVPIVVVLIGSYFIADLFFDVYEMAVDTTFICFLEDSEHNDGSSEKPYYMSKALLDILGKTNEKEKKSKK